MIGSAVTSNTSIVTMRAFDPDVVGSIFTRVDMSWSRDARATFRVSRMGDMSLIRSVHTARQSRSRRLERHITDRDDAYYFACTPLSGDMEIAHNGRSRGLKAGHLTLLSTQREYEISMSDHLEAIWLRIPAKLLQSHAIAVDDILWRPIDIRQGLGHVACQMMCNATSGENALMDRGARIFAQSLLSFLGEVITSTLTADGATASRGRRKILERAQKYIEEHICDEDLTPLQIAQGTGISARYLSEIFAAEGTSPMRWVRKRRLELCRMEVERLNGGQQLICEIAYSMGFNNVSSFNRAFKAQFGYSPRALVAKGGDAALDD